MGTEASSSAQVVCRQSFKGIPYFDGLEIGYILFDLQRRGQSMMTGALSLLTGYLFQSTKIHRVQLIISGGNIASEKVAQKYGLTYEGTARQAMVQRGIHRDIKRYSRLRNELETGLPNRLFS
jgi:ribosomal-protein-alanine N-acetyltransferase